MNNEFSSDASQAIRADESLMNNLSRSPVASDPYSKSFVILPKEAPPGTKLFIVTITKWNDLLRYIRLAEEQGYAVTNSSFKTNFRQEIEASDCFTTLRGWSETLLGQNMFYYAKGCGLPLITNYSLFKPKPDDINHVSSPDEPSQPTKPRTASKRKPKAVTPVPKPKTKT